MSAIGIRIINTTKQMKTCVYSLGYTSKLQKLIADPSIGIPMVHINLKNMNTIGKKIQKWKKNQHG